MPKLFGETKMSSRKKTAIDTKPNENGKAATANRKKNRSVPASLAVAEAGINTGLQFARFMSSLMTDVIAGAVPPGTCNAACNAGGKLLRVIELQVRYGIPIGVGGRKDLLLTLDLESEPKETR